MRKVLNFMLLAVFLPAAGNNVQISNLQMNSPGQITLELQWENSWNINEMNHDAVWVFFKLKPYNQSFEHVDLSNIDSALALSDTINYHAEVSDDGKGIMLARKSPGQGKLNAVQISIYTSNKIWGQYASLRVFAIEMIWVPKGSFYLGDSASINSLASSNGSPIQIANEDAILSINSGGDLKSLGGTDVIHSPYDLPASYPKGFEGFYCMKYEISQAQYVHFLNSLDQEGQNALSGINLLNSIKGDPIILNADLFRNGVVIEETSSQGPFKFGHDANGNGIFNEADDGQNRAMNFISWDALCAYLDWSGLRPMTELEFEKACRGPLYPVKREFAFGSNLVTDANTIINDGEANESVKDSIQKGSGLASHGYTGPKGPLRTGFGANQNSNRLEAGASYWGIMEMSGNLWEQCVSTSEEGSKFEGNHGDGEIQIGMSNVSSWPGKGAGSGFRGGGWNSGISLNVVLEKWI